MGDFQTFPWGVMLFFLVLPLAMLGLFAWMALSSFRRASRNQYEWSQLDGYEASETYRASREDSPYRTGQRPYQPQGQWRSFSFGPGLKTSLIVLGVFALISLIFAPRFLPGVFLFLPLFWVGGWSRTFTRGPSRRSTHPPVEQRPSERRTRF